MNGRHLDTSYEAFYHETLAHLSNRIRHQPFPAKLVCSLAADLQVSKEFVIDTLGLSRRVIFRKIEENKNLDPGQAERVVGMQRLISQVQAMIAESGNAEKFDAGRWLGKWIDQPLPALGGRRPAEYLGDSAGREWISQLLRQIQAGVFA
jgi:uncharacterized protein (DUF2384 family)